eukprot:scaffold312_cov256-Pinguiococcus_pyrenoidosus.AAC.15
MHHQRLRKITADIWGPGAAFGQNLFGVPTLITSGFSFKADDTFLEGGNIRTQADSDPLGALGDLGWYCIRFGLACHQYRWPQKAKSVRMIYNAQGVPIDSVAHIMWDSGDEDRPYVLQFQCSFMHPFRQWMEVCGSTKILKVEDFVISRPDNATYTTEMTGFLDYDIRPTTHTEHTETPRWPQEVRMFDTFAREVAALGDAGGKPSFWSYVTAATQACCDAVVTSSKNGTCGPPAKCWKRDNKSNLSFFRLWPLLYRRRSRRCPYAEPLLGFNLSRMLGSSRLLAAFLVDRCFIPHAILLSSSVSFSKTLDASHPRGRLPEPYIRRAHPVRMRTWLLHPRRRDPQIPPGSARPVGCGGRSWSSGRCRGQLRLPRSSRAPKGRSS